MTTLAKLLATTAATACLANTYAQSENAPLALSGAETQCAYAVEVETGNVVANYNGQSRLTPASITKLFPTAAALITYGPQGRIATNIGLSQDSTTLIVHAAFDPTTDSQHFKKGQMKEAADTIAASLRRMGIDTLRCLTADIHKGLFSPYCSKRLWEDMGNYYGAAPTSLMADDNMVNVFFSSPATLDSPCSIDSTIPQVGRAPVSFVRTYNGNADLCDIYMAGNDLWYATGCIPRSQKAFAVRAAMPDPEKHYLDKLARLIRQNGIVIDSLSLAKEQTDIKDSTIATILSPEMKEIIKVTNQNSINLFADALMMNIATKDSHATWSGSVAFLKEFWKKNIGFMPMIYDGSGLSPMGALAPSELTKLLVFMRHNKNYKEFLESLGVAGSKGTLRLLGAKTPIAGKVYGKSGSMTGVLAYAGYISANSGKVLAFCIILNHHTESNTVARREIAKWLEKLMIEN